MMADSTRTLEIDGVTLALRVTRKRVKNINVRLVGNQLRVSAPRWVSAAELVEAGMYGEIPEPLAPHIDYESIGRDLDCGGVYEIRHNFVGYYWTIQ